MAETPVPTLATDPAVARSLLEGEGIVDVRPAAELTPAGTLCWIDPSATGAELKPAYRALSELSPFPGGRVPGWVEVAGSAVIRLDDDTVEALNGKTVLSLAPLAGTEVALHAVRVHRLAEPLAAADLPADPSTVASEPALSDGAFAAKLDGLRQSLPGLK